MPVTWIMTRQSAIAGPGFAGASGGLTHHDDGDSDDGDWLNRLSITMEASRGPSPSPSPPRPSQRPSGRLPGAPGRRSESFVTVLFKAAASELDPAARARLRQSRPGGVAALARQCAVTQPSRFSTRLRRAGPGPVRRQGLVTVRHWHQVGPGGMAAASRAGPQPARGTQLAAASTGLRRAHWQPGQWRVAQPETRDQGPRSESQSRVTVHCRPATGSPAGAPIQYREPGPRLRVAESPRAAVGGLGIP